MSATKPSEAMLPGLTRLPAYQRESDSEAPTLNQVCFALYSACHDTLVGQSSKMHPDDQSKIHWLMPPTVVHARMIKDSIRFDETHLAALEHEIDELDELRAQPRPGQRLAESVQRMHQLCDRLKDENKAPANGIGV